MSLNKKSNKKSKTLEIVVARYNENLDWLKEIKMSKEIKITVYNKGANDIDIPFIPLPNIGRESHTYLYHIINNYDNLADQTIFCQGDSIFHSPGFLDLINKYRDEFEPIQPLSSWYWREGEPPHYLQNPPKPITNETKDLWLGDAPIHVEYMDNYFVTQYPFHYVENYYLKFISRIQELYGIENPLKFNVERFRLKNVDLNNLIPVCYAALFSVDKEVIRENSVDFYNNIMSILIYDIRNYNNAKKLDHGLFLEKLWLVMFNYMKNNKHYKVLKVKDFLLQNYNLTIKNNSLASFSYFNVYCQLFMKITIDNSTYNAFISKGGIYLKNNETRKLIYIHNFQHNKKNINKNIELFNILQDNKEYNVKIEYINQILKIYINDNLVIQTYKLFQKELKSVEIFDMGTYNKLIDNFINNKSIVKSNLKKSNSKSIDKSIIKSNLKKSNGKSIGKSILKSNLKKSNGKSILKKSNSKSNNKLESKHKSNIKK